MTNRTMHAVHSFNHVCIRPRRKPLTTGTNATRFMGLSSNICRLILTVGCCENTIAHSQAHLHRQPLNLRQQEEPRAVPAFSLQAPHRHLQLHRQDCRRADEARAPQRSRGRDQSLIPAIRHRPPPVQAGGAAQSDTDITKKTSNRHPRALRSPLCT